MRRASRTPPDREAPRTRTPFSYVSETAERLQLHRNTLVYRLQRIEEIGALDLEDAETRLSLQVAAELVDAYADGVFFVPLAPLRDPALVPGAIAARMGSSASHVSRSPPIIITAVPSRIC